MNQTNSNTVGNVQVNPYDICKVCNRPANAPYRRHVGGLIVEGCISAFHNGHLPTPSNTAAWHNRPEAKAFRRDATFDYNPKTGHWVK